jgi:hypothetical protein
MLISHRPAAPPAAAPSNRYKERDQKRLAAFKELPVVEAKLKQVQAENEALKAKVVELKGIVEELNKMKPASWKELGGMKEVAVKVTGVYPRVKQLKRAIDQQYCLDNSEFATRTTFDEDLQEGGKEQRFQWKSTKQGNYADIEELKAYVDYIMEATDGGLVVRARGEYGRGIQVIDSGDCWVANSICRRSVVHRDFDQGRHNSLAIVIALQNDVFGFKTGGCLGGCA